MRPSEQESEQPYIPIIIRPPAPKIRDLGLPGDIAIARAPSSGPPKVARFLGAWIGLWGDSLPHVLVVERAEASGAVHVLYSTGDSPISGAGRQSRRLSGIIRDDKLMLDTPHARVTYEFDSRGRLLGRHFANIGSLAVGMFEPITLEELFDSDCPVPHPTLGEAVHIPHRSAMTSDGSRPITLAATLYRREGTASAPLAIINHGSTGAHRIDPGRTFRHETEALWLMELGFNVLVPMRRGRGKSEGIFGEERGIADVDLDLNRQSKISRRLLHTVVRFPSCGTVRSCLSANHAADSYLSCMQPGIRSKLVA
jgi:hypothetical protein